MNRINILFEQKKRNILSVYFTAGYPHIDDTCKIVHELQSQGADMVEIGIPFSDPMAGHTGSVYPSFKKRHVIEAAIPAIKRHTPRNTYTYHTNGIFKPHHAIRI